jgi:hypothetical protein
MYTTYEVTIGNDTKQYKLQYQLRTHRPAQVWAGIVKNLTVNDLRPTLDPWRGLARSWDQKFNEFKQLIKDINQWVPEKINEDWYNGDIEQSLNNLHTSWPEPYDLAIDPIKKEQLIRFNDLIHGLQVINSSKKFNKDILYILLCSKQSNFIPFEAEDYQYFSPTVSFGDLTLHYTEVGRHPLELYMNNDTNCPLDQIVPQTVISFYHTLRFFDIPARWEGFSEFYHSSGITWPYKLEDPRLAVGYIPLGKLKSINDNFYTREEAFNTVYSCNQIIGWTVH